MKIVCHILLLFLFVYQCKLGAQNLVPDSSFEVVRRMPEKKNNSIYCTQSWMSPTSGGASDYYHKDARKHSGAPRNIFGRQKPHSGNAYAGICIRTNFMEYLQTKLFDTLAAEQDYLIEFYICKAERSIGTVKEFGVLFANKISIGLPGTCISAYPSVKLTLPQGFRNKRKWIKFSAVYRAQGNEAALILGHFMYQKSKPFKGFSHYYIDDVSVTCIKNKTDSLSNLKQEKANSNFLKLKQEEITILKNVFFETNESELLEVSYAELNKVLNYLFEHPSALIQIFGHSDNSGNEAQNIALSQGRAKAVANYLTEKGIHKSRIRYFGFGSSKPIHPNDSEEGRKQNRRVEFLIQEL